MSYSLPSVITGESSVYTESRSVTCKGQVTDDGGAIVSERGICYIKGHGTPTISNKKVSGGSGVGEFSCSFNVPDEGTYTYRAFATNSKGTAYGNAKTISVTVSQTASAMVQFGNDVWYDDNTYVPSAWWQPSQRSFSLMLDDEAWTKEANVSITPCYEETITGSIVPTPAEVALGAGGYPIHNVESGHYTGPTFQVDYPYNEEDNWHSYFHISIEYFDQNGKKWVPKSFTVNVTAINAIIKICSITVDAVMIKAYDGYTSNYINTAETRALRIEAYNIPLKIE